MLRREPCPETLCLGVNTGPDVKPVQMLIHQLVQEVTRILVLLLLRNFFRSSAAVAVAVAVAAVGGGGVVVTTAALGVAVAKAVEVVVVVVVV